MVENLRPTEDLVKSAIQKAQEKFREFPPSAGAIVACPDNPVAYQLKGIQDGKAVMGYVDPQTGREVTKIRSTDGLFETQTVKEILSGFSW